MSRHRLKIGRCTAILFLLAIIFIYFGSKSEIVDTDEYGVYYDISEEANGGFELIDDNYLVFEWEYLNKPKEKVVVKDELQKKIEAGGPPVLYGYHVKSGDTLSGIAYKYGVGLTILRANNPKVTANIRIGQKIMVPNRNGIFYKVKKNQTVDSISSTYKVDKEKILLDNRLTSSTLKVGQVLFLDNPDIRAIKDEVRRQSNKFTSPVKYIGISSKYGTRFHPVLKRYIMHKGVDLRAKYVPVVAARSGKVTFAGWSSGYGNLIIIKHSNGYETRYGHLNKMYVKVGQYVKEGSKIAQSGATGRVTGPHLHFEIRRNGKTYDPMKYIEK